VIAYVRRITEIPARAWLIATMKATVRRDA